MAEGPDSSAALLFDALRGVLSQVAAPSQLLKTILAEAVSHTGADRGLFAEVGRGGHVSYRVLYRFQKEALAGQAGHFSKRLFAQALGSGRAVRVSNAMNDPRFDSTASVHELRLCSVLCVPIQVEGQTVALVHLESNTPDHFSEKHERLLESLLKLAAPALGALQAGEGMLRERDALREAESVAQRELEENREVLARDWSFSRFIGRSAAVRDLEATLRKAAETDFPVLLLGETGTGKSILARVLHHIGTRSKKTFVTVFCPSLEKGMVETELFGHKRGAFTGAVADRVGKVQAAEKGTLFLDELGELPMDIQPKLLRLLQEKTYERIGDPAERPADVRVVAATNRDLDEEIRAGRFRRDLFERLNYVPIRIPPLRERTEDIPLLLQHILRHNDAGRWVEMSEDALTFLRDLDFAWPGNVRHLEQLAARLAMERFDRPVTAQDVRRLLGTTTTGSGDGRRSVAAELEKGLPKLLEEEERKWLQEALRHHADLTRADLAAKLKISEAALYKKLREYELGR